LINEPRRTTKGTNAVANIHQNTIKKIQGLQEEKVTVALNSEP
jgi:hypothetical protein